MLRLSDLLRRLTGTGRACLLLLVSERANMALNHLQLFKEVIAGAIQGGYVYYTIIKPSDTASARM